MLLHTVALALVWRMIILCRVLSLPFKQVHTSDRLHFDTHVAKLLEVVQLCLHADVPAPIQCRAATVCYQLVSSSLAEHASCLAEDYAA